MKSNELAQLAAVSIRTLRHYHDLGLMPEPPRLSNGYRDYQASDLVRLLRIKHLATLGFSLAQIATMLDDLDEHPDDNVRSATAEALNALDDDLASRIQELEEKRKTIQLLKAEQLAPDMPIRFARIWQLLKERNELESISPDMNDALLLAGHLYTESELDELENVVDALQDATISRNLETIQDRCLSLTADASQSERDTAVREAIELIEPLIDCFEAKNWEGESTLRDETLKDAVNKGLNEAQLEVIMRIQESIAQKLHVQPSGPEQQSDQSG